ncbi:hypothetical protein L6452_46909 [Arctium lappa]|nr:hypothetical protein L6452_46909 [Arctium lappa]
MWRYPSTASFLEGLWPFRPRKFEAITVAPEAIRPRARLPGRHASRRPRPRLPSGDACLPCPWCGWPKKESPLTDARLVVVVKAFVSSRADAREALSNDPKRVVLQRRFDRDPREADGGRRCVPVGCGTARAGPPIDSGRGPVRIGAAAKARAVDMPVEMPSRRSWLAARAVTACLGTCGLPAPACGHPIRPVLKHGPRSQTCDGAAASLSRAHGIESSKWAIFGKQNWRCGMNRKPGYGAKLRANLEPTKGVGRLRQQDGGHGSRNPLRTLPTLESTQSEVGSSGWKSTARRAVSGAPPAALENPEDRVPPTPGLTHNRISPEPVGCRRTARAASAARAGRRVPAGGRIGKRPSSGAFPGRRTANSELKSRVEQKGKSSFDSDFQYELRTVKAWPNDPLDLRNLKLEVGSLLILVRSTLVAQAQLATIRAYDMVMRVCDALRCSGPHARYTDVFNEYIALADRPGKSLKFHRDGDRSLQLLVLNEEFLVSASHQLALTTCARSHSAEGTSAWASRIASPPTTPPQWGCVSFGAETGLPCPWCGWPKKESPLTDARLVVVVKAFVSSRADAREALSNDPNVSSCNDASTATPADGGRRCVPVGCGTARAGPPIDSGRGPVRIGAAAKARAVDMPVEMPSRRSWLAARAVTACLGTCVLPAPACGHPIRPVLKHGPRSLTCVGRRGCFVEPCHGIESSKWAIFGKQNWRCGMNRKPGYGAKLRANLEPTKGVGRLRQQDGGHGSRNPLRSV